MAESPEETLERVNKTILSSVDAAFSPKFTNKLAKKTAIQLVKRTRLGFGVDEITGNQVRLQKLSENYIKVRKGDIEFYTNKKTKQVFVVVKGGSTGKSRKARKSRGAGSAKSSKGVLGQQKKSKKKPRRLARLSRQTSPRKSNLTGTGGMLNSVRGVGRKQKIIIEIPDSPHGPSITNQPVELTNAELARVHQKGATIRHPSGITIKIPARRFFDLSKAEINGVIRETRQFILKLTRARLG